MYSVLILDDDEAVRQSLVDYFEDREWTVFQAESGEEALQVLQQHTIDGAVIDLRLPGMDGVEFIRASLSTGQNLASILCTGSPEYQLPEDFIQHTFISHELFHKPVIDITKLENHLKELIAGNS